MNETQRKAIDALCPTPKPLSAEDFLAKVSWEGGVEDAIIYGLRPEDCADATLAEIWRCLIAERRAP